GTVIEEDEIIATVTTGSPVGILSPRQAAVSVYYSHGVLTVYTPKAEQIDVYSFSGARLFTAKKPAGEASYRVWAIQEKALIVRGSSGWVKKITE
ncbi:MAG: hypothetical protein LBQ39_09760, partial [Tannerellaceae bacterium]|nr:hypothetical protein [Tannerellaceae bacterium]